MNHWLELFLSAFLGVGLQHLMQNRKVTNALEALKRGPLLLSSFRIKKEILDDTWNQKPKTAYSCEVLADDDTVVASFDYRAAVGQVYSLYVHKNYKGRGLEEQMLIYMMKDMQDLGATTIWEVCSPKHNCWGKIIYDGLWCFCYKPGREVHPSVRGGGYVMPIPQDPRTLQIQLKKKGQTG